MRGVSSAAPLGGVLLPWPASRSPPGLMVRHRGGAPSCAPARPLGVQVRSGGAAPLPPPESSTAPSAAKPWVRGCASRESAGVRAADGADQSLSSAWTARGEGLGVSRSLANDTELSIK